MFIWRYKLEAERGNKPNRIVEWESELCFELSMYKYTVTIYSNRLKQYFMMDI